MSALPEVEVYTDGACSGNPGPGGWGQLQRYGPVQKELAGGGVKDTNNRRELNARRGSSSIPTASMSKTGSPSG